MHHENLHMLHVKSIIIFGTIIYVRTVVWIHGTYDIDRFYSINFVQLNLNKLNKSQGDHNNNIILN